MKNHTNAVRWGRWPADWRGFYVSAVVGFFVCGAFLPVAAAPAPPVKVACVGDSITAGSHSSDRAHNYPTLLGKLMGASYQVANFGESGATLLKNGDKPYWSRPPFGKSAAFAPNVVIVMLGTNDSKPQNWAHQDQFAADYAALLNYYAALPTHPKLYVCLPTPVVKDNYGIREPEVEAELPLIRQVAAQKNAAIIDVHGQMPTDPADYADGVHPNDAGYALLAGVVYQGVTHAPVILPIGGASFTDPVEVTLKPPTPDATVRYTTDGSRPTAKSPPYTGSFLVKDTATVQAQAFVSGKPLGSVSAATFTRTPPS